jgi:hypothetical protein
VGSAREQGAPHAAAVASRLSLLLRGTTSLQDLQLWGLEDLASLGSNGEADGLACIGRLARLSSLRLPRAWRAPPAWLSSLTALSRIEAGSMLFSLHTLATLAALPALAEVHGFSWSDTWAQAGGALPAVAACCPRVAVLRRCSIYHTGLASLAAAFPGLREATEISVFDGCRAAAPHLAAPAPPPPAPWRGLQTLQMSGLNNLVYSDDVAAAFSTLLSLLRGASGLTSLDLGSIYLASHPGDYIDDEDFELAAWRSADVAALLPLLPRTMESLAFYPVAALTDAAFVSCPYLPALRSLDLRWAVEPPQLTLKGLLALGRALPGLQSLRLAYCGSYYEGITEHDFASRRAAVEQLDALCGGGFDYGAFYGDEGEAAEAVDGKALLIAIRRALAHEAAAGVRLA